MTKPAVKSAIKWVKDFRIGGVVGDPDALHDDLYKLEKLIIEQLPLTDAKVAASYQSKLAEVREKKIELWDVEIGLNEVLELMDSLNAAPKIQLFDEIAELMRQIENNEIDAEDQLDEVKALYVEAKMLLEGVEIEDDESYDKMFGYLSDVETEREKSRLESEESELKERHINLWRRKAQLEKEISDMENDVRVMQENAFKAMAESESMRSVMTYTVKGEEPIVIDSAATTVAKKLPKEKQFSENFVFADMTFIVKHGRKKYEVSVPIKVPGESVANLSRFKPAEYMSLGLGKTYDSSNEFLAQQIKRRFLKGEELLGIKREKDKESAFDSSSLFSHSEQTLFSALLDSPEVRNRIARQLKKKLGLSDDDSAAEYSIDGVVLDLHTSRYMCSNCATSALGLQDNSDSKLSFKNLLLAAVRREMPDINVGDDCAVHMRVGASKDFDGPRKSAADHDARVEVKSDALSQRDMRLGRSLETYSPRDLALLMRLKDHTLFTSGDTENQRFKTAFAWALQPLLATTKPPLRKLLAAYRSKEGSSSGADAEEAHNPSPEELIAAQRARVASGGFYADDELNHFIESEIGDDAVYIEPAIVEVPEELAKSLSDFKESDEDQAVLVINAGHNHYTAIHILRQDGEPGFSLTYFDPSYEALHEIPDHVAVVMAEKFPDIEIVTATSVIQTSSGEEGIDNSHCGAFVACLMAEMVKGNVRLKDDGSNQLEIKISDDDWYAVESLTKEQSDDFGNRIRDFHLKILDGEEILEHENQSAILRNFATEVRDAKLAEEAAKEAAKKPAKAAKAKSVKPLSGFGRGAGGRKK